MVTTFNQMGPDDCCGAGLAAERVLAAGWLEERQHIDVTEATDCGLKALVRLMVKCSCLEVLFLACQQLGITPVAL